MFWVVLGIGVVVALGILLIGGMTGRGASIRRDTDGGTTAYTPIADGGSHRSGSRLRFSINSINR